MSPQRKGQDLTNPLLKRGVELSPLAFGGAPVGNLYASVNETEALDAIVHAWHGGIRHFDTAPYLPTGEPQEFFGWQWQRLDRLPGLVTPHKRAVYERVAQAFAPFAG